MLDLLKRRYALSLAHTNRQNRSDYCFTQRMQFNGASAQAAGYINDVQSYQLVLRPLIAL